MASVTSYPLRCPRCRGKTITTITYAVLVVDAEGNPLAPGGSHHCGQCGLMWGLLGHMGATAESVSDEP